MLFDLNRMNQMIKSVAKAELRTNATEIHVYIEIIFKESLLC